MASAAILKIMLTKCVNCGFYVRQDDEFCLNCGIESPTSELPSPVLNRNGIIICAGIAIFLVILFVDFPITPLILAFYTFVGLFGVFILFTIVFLKINSLINDWRIEKQINRRISDKINSLSGKEKTINERIDELSAREAKINAVLNKIKASDGRNLQEARRKLLSAREIVAEQSTRYEMQKRKIELVRAQNNVAPYLFNLNNLDENEAEKALQSIAETKIELDLMRRDLKKSIVTDFIEMFVPEKPFPEKESFLRQLKETENSCEKLREAVLSRQAARALEGISPLKENLISTGAPEIAHAAETFNIQTVLTDFGESFEELEREYRRVLRESETSRKLLEI